LGLVLVAGCGQSDPDTGNETGPEIGKPDASGAVIKARAVYEVSSDGTSFTGRQVQSVTNATASVPVTVTSASSASMSLSTTLFVVPPISTELLDFGFIQISGLNDNDLRVCGTNGNQKCGTASIRMYTTGTAGAGLYNSTDGYGAPIQAGQSTLATVGLGSANAATMQSISIASNKNVVKLSDFTNPKYNVKVDFSNAGAGSYSTTMVVEYILSP
jgi:hypothetical protein